MFDIKKMIQPEIEKLWPVLKAGYKKEMKKNFIIIKLASLGWESDDHMKELVQDLDKDYDEIDAKITDWIK